MSQSQVVEWYRRFRDGSRLLGDEKGPGRVYTYTFFLNASARQSILKMNDYYTHSARGLHSYSDSYRGLNTQRKLISV